MTTKRKPRKAKAPERVYYTLTPHGSLDALRSLRARELRELDDHSLGLARHILLELEAACCYELRRRAQDARRQARLAGGSNVIPFRLRAVD